MIINLSGLGLGSLSRRKAANLEETLEQVAAPLSNLLLLYRARKKRAELIAELEAANEQDMLEVEYCRQQIAFLHQKEEENHKRVLAMVNTGGSSGSVQASKGRGANSATPAADELASQYYWEEPALEGETQVQIQEQVVAAVSSSVSNSNLFSSSSSSSSEELAATTDFTPANTFDNTEDEDDEAGEEVEDEALEYDYEEAEDEDEADNEAGASDDYLPPDQVEAEEKAELDLGVTDFSEFGSAGESEKELELAGTSAAEQIVTTSAYSVSVTAKNSSPSPGANGVPSYVSKPVATSPAEQELDELMAELNNLVG